MIKFIRYFGVMLVLLTALASYQVAVGQRTEPPTPPIVEPSTLQITSQPGKVGMAFRAGADTYEFEITPLSGCPLRTLSTTPSRECQGISVTERKNGVVAKEWRVQETDHTLDFAFTDVKSGRSFWIGLCVPLLDIGRLCFGPGPTVPPTASHQGVDIMIAAMERAEGVTYATFKNLEGFDTETEIRKLNDLFALVERSYKTLDAMVIDEYVCQLLANLFASNPRAMEQLRQALARSGLLSGRPGGPLKIDKEKACKAAKLICIFSPIGKIIACSIYAACIVSGIDPSIP